MGQSPHKLMESNSSEIARLIDQLGDEDWHRRHLARVALEELDGSATPSLIEALSDPKQSVRWEAAKALITIKDPRAARALVRALMDKSFEVQWLAAEALIALGDDAIVPILQELLVHPESYDLLKGAHHVLHHREHHGLLDPMVAKVVDDIRSIGWPQPYILSARLALEAMGIKPGNAA